MIVGYDARIPGEVIEGRTFEGCHIGIVVAADNVTIRRTRFRRLISDGTNGCAVAVQQGVIGCKILDCDVDGTESVADAAAFFLYPGTDGCIVRGNDVRDWPQVGIACGSTTYVDFASALPWSAGHLLEGNTLTRCGRLKTGDAGAGIAVIGMSHRIVSRGNVIRRCGGHGIVYGGSIKGDGSPGTPALDESPTWGQIASNICEYNAGAGIRNSGANYTWIKDNFAYSNTQGGVVVVPIGGTSDGRGVESSGNRVA